MNTPVKFTSFLFTNENVDSWNYNRIMLNSIILARADTQFDPYPYILLNLVLSTLAAIQAPVVMMSQNRQAEKDRLRAGNSFEVALKTELAIQQLKDKIGQLQPPTLAPDRE